MNNFNTRTHLIVFSLLLMSSFVQAQNNGPADTSQGYYSVVSRKLIELGLHDLGAYTFLRELVSIAPERFSGTPGYQFATDFVARWMKKYGLENVRLEPVVVPRWERGSTEQAVVLASGRHASDVSLSICALGGSIATPPEGVAARVLEVHSFEELAAKEADARRNIVFFNVPMDPEKLNTRDAYRAVARYRTKGAIEAAKRGALAVLVRSLTLAKDDVPHTGTVEYNDQVTHIPAAALGTLSADLLSNRVKEDEHVRAKVVLSCQPLGNVESFNVVGEIRGLEKPNEIVLVGAHLDAWDVGTGAHDDGAGCAHVLEALDLIRRAGLKPKRTIRVVLFTNEEHGASGAAAYATAAARVSERHIAAIESDHGGFAPRGFNFETDSVTFRKFLQWRRLFEELNAGKFAPGFTATDIQPLVAKGVTGIGLDPENHRYFDYHHSANDTIDKVHPRELEMGAIVIGLLSFLIAETSMN